ncbi:MAG TPA: O-antigen ligase family protein [Flavobacterium sp.]|nr:O-antigen ligase family protein [Flavobacterium sp.]
MKYFLLISVHIALGVLIYLIRPTSFILSLLIILFGILYIIKNKDRNNEALYFSAYIVGIEALMRMTEGLLFYELAKYSVILFMTLGMFYRGISKQAGYYFVFILLLLPAILLTVQNLGSDINMRKAIAFNLSGPVCLGISAMYCVQRAISVQRLINVLLVLGLPIVSTMVYLFLYTPSNLEELITSAGSNPATTGGFGPNQVSTILGLGMFAFTVQILLNSKNKLLLVVNTLLLALIAYRGLISFSRGGVITALIIIVLLIIMIFIRSNQKAKNKLSLVVVLSIFLGFGVWSYTSLQTGGVIENRYRNENAKGEQKESLLTGREVLIATELQMFYENPIFGVGVGRNKEVREEETGIEAASHNEISRTLAEHGMLGVIGLLILIFVPLTTFSSNRENIFLLSFFVFWALTINHAAMRMAVPSFVYALSLLKVTFNEDPPLHRE